MFSNLTAGWTKSTYTTNHSIFKANESDIRIEEKVDTNLKNVLELVEAFEFEKLFELTTVNVNEESTDNTVTDDIIYSLYTAENRRHECPRLLIKILD